MFNGVQWNFERIAEFYARQSAEERADLFIHRKEETREGLEALLETSQTRFFEAVYSDANPASNGSIASVDSSMIERSTFLHNYHELSPDKKAELFMMHPGKTREAIEILKQRQQDIYNFIVPEGMDPLTCLYTREYLEGHLLERRLASAASDNKQITYARISVTYKDADKVEEQRNRLINLLRNIIASRSRGVDDRRHQTTTREEERRVAERRKLVGFDPIGYLGKDENTDEFGVIVYNGGKELVYDLMTRYQAEKNSKFTEAPIVRIGLATTDTNIKDHINLKNSAERHLAEAKKYNSDCIIPVNI